MTFMKILYKDAATIREGVVANFDAVKNFETLLSVTSDEETEKVMRKMRETVLSLKALVVETMDLSYALEAAVTQYEVVQKYESVVEHDKRMRDEVTSVESEDERVDG